MQIHDKIPLEIRLKPLTIMEMAEAEDILCDSFIKHEPRIRETILSEQKKSFLEKEIRERINIREVLTHEIVKIITERWGPRVESERYALAEVCVAKFWSLTDEEIKVKEEMRKAIKMSTKNTNITL